jgi:hypothetical protein
MGTESSIHTPDAPNLGSASELFEYAYTVEAFINDSDRKISKKIKATKQQLNEAAAELYVGQEVI